LAVYDLTNHERKGGILYLSQNGGKDLALEMRSKNEDVIVPFLNKIAIRLSWPQTIQAILN